MLPDLTLFLLFPFDVNCGGGAGGGDVTKWFIPGVLSDINKANFHSNNQIN